MNTYLHSRMKGKTENKHRHHEKKNIDELKNKMK